MFLRLRYRTWTRAASPRNGGRNFLRTLATPEAIKVWSLTGLREKLIKIGAKVVSHGRYVAFEMAEVAIPRSCLRRHEAKPRAMSSGLGNSNRPPKNAAIRGISIKENSVAKFLLVYKGGGMPHPAQSETIMAAWRRWFGSLGEAVVDGGRPFAGSKSVAVGGSVREGALSGLTGYSILAADSLDAAATLAKGCPILAGGGSVEIYETIEAL